MAYSQGEMVRYTEAQIAVQDKYVEAKKYVLIGRFEKAEEILSNLYKEDRNNAAIAMELSKVYSYLDDPYNQLKYAEKSYQNASSNEYVVANYAKICMDQQKYDSAIEALTKLVKSAPKNEEYTDHLATAYLNIDDASSAIKAYNAIEANIGITENVSRRKYEIYEILGNDKDALNELIKLADTYPYQVRYMHNVASYYTKIGKAKKALEVYRKILAVDVNDPEANIAITTASTGEGDDNNYLRSLAPLIENKTIPVDRKVLELVPYVDQLNKKYDQELADALVMLSDKISLNHPSEAKAHALKGDILMASGNIKGAAKAYEKTISINDKIFSVWEGWMEALAKTEDHAKLKSVATDVLDLFPNKPSAYMHYGRAHTLSNDATEAIDLLQEGLMVSGKDIYSKSNIQAELGRAYAAKKDYDKALEAIAQALDISQNQNALAFEIQGDIYKAKGDNGKAKESWKKAQKAGNQSKALTKKING